MLGFSFGEILFLAVLALIVIGPKQLPEVARNIARFLNELKRTTNTFTNEIKAQARVDLDEKPRPSSAPQMPNNHETTHQAPPQTSNEEKKS